MKLKKEQSNTDINQLKAYVDLITDEYGNYYFTLKTKHNDDNHLTNIILSNVYYDMAYSYIINSTAVNFSGVSGDNFDKEYNHQFVGKFFLEKLNQFLQRMKDSQRKLFTVKDLQANGTEIHFIDVTQPHARERS